METMSQQIQILSKEYKIYLKEPNRHYRIREFNIGNEKFTGRHQ